MDTNFKNLSNNEMRLNCQEFNSGESIRVKLNDVIYEHLYEDDEEIIDTIYSVPSTRELVPPHILSDLNRDSHFTIKAGLILFHAAIHPKDIEFDYPKCGSFYATTPAHSLTLICVEKKDMIVKNNQTGRLLTYVLKKDITVIDAPGDKYNENCSSLKYDGVVGGYYRDSDVMSNLNEIRICKKDMENYLIKIDERIITKDDLEHRLFRDGLLFDDMDYYMTFNNTINIKICAPEKLHPWTSVNSVDLLLFIYFDLKSRNIELDLETLYLLFNQSDIYIDSNNIDHTINNILIVYYSPRKGNYYVKIFSTDNDLKLLWKLSSFLIERYKNLTEGCVLNNMKIKSTEDISIVFFDNFAEKFQNIGYIL